MGLNDAFTVVDGRMVSERVQRICLAIKDYEPNIEIKWLPPEARRDKATDTVLPAYEIVYHENGQKITLMYVKDDKDFDERILWRIIVNDQRNGKQNWNEFSAWEESQKLIKKQEYLDELEQAQDIAEHVLKSHLNKYVVTPNLVIRDGIPFNTADMGK